MALDIQIHGLEELGRDVVRAVDAAAEALQAEAQDVLREGVAVVKAYTPVVTGKTRRGIHSRIRPRGRGAVGGIRAAYAAAPYISRVEERHGMFRRGFQFVDRVAVDRLQDAVDDAVDQVFRRR